MSLAFILSFQQVVGYELEKLFTSRFLPTITFIGHGIVAVIYASRMVRYQSDKISWKLMDRLTIYFVISFLEITANLIALYRHSIITNRGSIEVSLNKISPNAETLTFRIYLYPITTTYEYNHTLNAKILKYLYFIN